jgi:hypothetical protein
MLKIQADQNEIAPFLIQFLKVVYRGGPILKRPNYACLFFAFGGQRKLSSGVR